MENDLYFCMRNIFSLHVYSVYIISEKDIINKFCLEFHINTYAHACDQSNNSVSTCKYNKNKLVYNMKQSSKVSWQYGLFEFKWNTVLKSRRNLKLATINCYTCNSTTENDHNGEDLKSRLNTTDWDFIRNGENLV